MRIATWNVERLKHVNELDRITAECNRMAADILVLTETDCRIKPSFKNFIESDNLDGTDAAMYKKTENRVSICTDYRIIREHETYDRNTAVCAEIETERGSLIVYGTIIGIYGNRDASFMRDLIRQTEDIRRLSRMEKPLCICGDYNLSFGDNYYFTKDGRNALEAVFEENALRLLTRDVEHCVDHIAVSQGFGSMGEIKITEWNIDKQLSDHKGIMVEL